MTALMHPSPLLDQVALCFPDAFSGGQDGTIRRWCLTTGSCLQLLLAHQDAVRREVELSR